MDRLTKHTPIEFGYAEYHLVAGVDQEDAISHLAAYEDTGLTPNEIWQLKAELHNCRNELCLKCGKYREAHNGACDGCRWKGEA